MQDVSTWDLRRQGIQNITGKKAEEEAESPPKYKGSHPHRDEGIWEEMSLWEVMPVHTRLSNCQRLLHLKGLLRQEGDIFFHFASASPRPAGL